MVLGVVVLIGCGVSIWWAYREYYAKLDQYKQEVAVGTRDGATDTERQAAEGKDETEPGADALARYQVEPSLPRAIYIDKAHVRARVLPMSLNPDSSIQAPINIHDAGWYTASVRPGEKGAMLIDGHASGPSRKGLFAYIDTLSLGDEVVIERGDGTKLTYEVVHKTEVPVEQVDMQQALEVYQGDEGLNLITCSGHWLREQKTFDKRTLIFTRRKP